MIREDLAAMGLQCLVHHNNIVIGLMMDTRDGWFEFTEAVCQLE